jgi:hypothetical protein
MDTQIFWDKLSTKQRQIAEAARKYPGESLKSVGGPRSDIILMWSGCTAPMN